MSGFTRLPPSQWRSVRTTDAIERLHEEFKRRIKTQTVLPSADTTAMLFWAVLASGQINMRKSLHPRRRVSTAGRRHKTHRSAN
jgi:transposase-like protein